MLESVWLKYKLGPCALCLWVALPRPCVCVCLKVMFSHRLNVKRKALTKCVCSSSRMCDPDPHHSPLCVCPYVQMIDDPSSSRVRSRYATFPVQIFCVCVCLWVPAHSGAVQASGPCFTSCFASWKPWGVSACPSHLVLSTHTLTHLVVLIQSVCLNLINNVCLHWGTDLLSSALM